MSSQNRMTRPVSLAGVPRYSELLSLRARRDELIDGLGRWESGDLPESPFARRRLLPPAALRGLKAAVDWQLLRAELAWAPASGVRAA